MLKRTLIVLILILISTVISSQETIVDSVYSEMGLDGQIVYYGESHCFGVNVGGYDIFVGDITFLDINLNPIEFNSVVRGFLSFDLPEIPMAYAIDSVYIRLYQGPYCEGYNSYTNTILSYPYWDVPGGENMYCHMSHIIYGDELDSLDWEKGDEGNHYTINSNIGIISGEGQGTGSGFRFLNVTSSVVYDYENNHEKSQFRLSYPIDTDYDNYGDNIWFRAHTPSSYHVSPTLFFYLRNITPLVDDSSSVSIMQLTNYPNPFNPMTEFSYSLSKENHVKLSIFNIKGELVTVLVDKIQSKGQHSCSWNAQNQSSGVYFYKLETENQTITKKCILMK